MTAVPAEDRPARHDWAGRSGTTSATRYRLMADYGFKNVSPTYERLSRAIVDDAEVLALLDGLPAEKRQPNLLFGAARLLHAPLGDYADFRRWLVAHWDAAAEVMRTRRTQTNEPGRCAPWLPLLAQIDGPVALLEIGASMGLCLFPDRYAYRYSDGTAVGDSPVEIPCRVEGNWPRPARLPDVVWRVGLDLNPLDVSSDDDLHWLECLIWPEETERFARLRAAAAIARDDPPRIVRGDLLRDTATLVAQAPPEATLVLFHSAVLAYLDTEGRAAFTRLVRDLAAQRPLVWLAQEGDGVLTDVPDGWTIADTLSPFVLTRDGAPVALVDSRGATLHWYR